MPRCSNAATQSPEGSERSDKDFAHFLDIALGSLAELDTQFLIAERQGFLFYTDEIAR